MDFRVLGSGSKGNCYLLTDNNGNHLIIECGIHQSDIKKAIDFSIDMVSGVIVTHGHSDHAKSMVHLLTYGINVYASKGTFKETGLLSHHRANVMKEKETYTIGPFRVMPFAIVHDTLEPFGFIIQHRECGRIVFLTDTMYSKFRFKDVVFWIVEANYDEDIIDAKGGDKMFLRNRVISSHMSIQTLEEMLESNDLSNTRSIVLTHLSDRNSNMYTAKQRIQDAFGKETFIAEPGLTINMNKTPF